jgi:hypothetical protein
VLAVEGDKVVLLAGESDDNRGGCGASASRDRAVEVEPAPAVPFLELGAAFVLREVLFLAAGVLVMTRARLPDSAVFATDGTELEIFLLVVTVA